MATPRDEMRSRRFALSQAASALCAPVAGWRRGAIGAGAAVVAVSLTIAAAIGLFSGHGAAAQPVAAHSLAESSAGPPSPAAAHPSASTAPVWQRDGVLLVDATTGDRYLFRAGKLRPVRNETSAYLILGTAKPSTMPIPHAAVAATAVGAPIGIGGIPSRTPDAGALVHGGWVACSGPVSTGGTPAVRIVAPGAGSLGGTGFAGYGSGLSGGVGMGSGALVVTAGGDDYLIRHHRRSSIAYPGAVFAAWKWTAVVPLPVAVEVLDALLTDSPVTPSTPRPVRIELARSSTLCVALNTAGAAVHTVVRATVGAGVGRAHLVLAARHGVVIRAGKTLYLVTDRGTAFPIANAAALASLGYRSAAVVSVPPSVIGLIPKGPTLSRYVAING